VTIDAGGQIDSKVEIKYSIHTSIENPRIKMMGGLSIPYYSYVGRNVLDYKTEHKFGDNCWLTPWSWNGDDVISDSEIGAISFIRNNVQVGISNNGRYYDNPSALIAVAGKIDQALINCEKVATADLLNAPVITSFEVISGSNVVGAIDEVVVEAKATDPMGEDLAYSMYPGFSGLWGNGTFSISRIEMAGTYKYGVWVMNESHLTSFAKMELTFIEPVPVASQTPQTFNLYQNRPNPFNPATTITFSLPFSGMVRLSVYNMLGQEVTRLVDSYLPAGVHNVVFNGAGLSSGVYFYRIDSGNFSSTRKMLFIQ
jgi:hypothetical protein